MEYIQVKVRQVKDLNIKTSNVLISYARNGHLLYEGEAKNIPEHLLDYYVTYFSEGLIKTYIECVEDTKWFDIEENSYDGRN